LSNLLAVRAESFINKSTSYQVSVSSLWLGVALPDYSLKQIAANRHGVNSSPFAAAAV
jgi:hypothetical protein